MVHSEQQVLGTPTLSIETERHELLVVAKLTSNQQEAMLQLSTLQVVFELIDDVPRLPELAKWLAHGNQPAED